jgi:hypothetical protein
LRNIEGRKQVHPAYSISLFLSAVSFSSPALAVYIVIFMYCRPPLSGGHFTEEIFSTIFSTKKGIFPAAGNTDSFTGF